MIKAIEFIKTGFSVDDANKLDIAIQAVFANEQNIVVDFKGISIFTTLFFNNVFAKYIMQVGPLVYNQKFKLINLTELGESTYKHSYDNAINFYNLSDEEKQNQEDILTNPEE